MDVTIKRRAIDSNSQFTKTLHPVLERVYLARGLCQDEELEQEFKHLLTYHALKGVDVAADVIAQSILSQEKIMLVGDYDTDGATSSALAVRALKAMHAQHVDFIVPNRFEYGYGLTPEIVELAATKTPDLLITVDNGISSIEGVDTANAKNMKVVVTDHHLAGRELPKAAAIVNPNQPGDEFPSKCIAGVGVIFYVVLAVRQRLRELNWFADKEEPNLAMLLDLVALGTIADVVPLDRNNRILAHQGLRRIKAGKCCVGILALMDVAKRDYKRVVASDMGFSVAPRLNAAGRLEDMSLGIELLLSDDRAEAKKIALELDRLNQDRRELEQGMQKQARAALDSLSLTNQALPLGLALYDPSWHQGVIGIVASRIKDQFHRPVMAFANANEQEIKGSARSVQGFHIRDALDAIAVANPGLIAKFGGHAMAAGLSLRLEDFDRFKQAFERYVSENLPTEALNQVILSDGELNENDISLDLAQCLRNAGPWGQAFPEPLFDGEFSLLDQRIVGQKHLKMTLSHGDEILNAIAFNVDLKVWPDHHCKRIKAAYKLDVNHYMGRSSVQLLIEYLERIE